MKAIRLPINSQTAKIAGAGKKLLFKYAIEIDYKIGDLDCRLEDMVEANSLAAAYDAATKIADKLNSKAEREDAFSVLSVVRIT